MIRAENIIKRGQSGFSMTELLVTLAIVVMVSAVIATGVPVAQRAYVSAVNASNSQLLLSTTTTRLRDVLSVAKPDSVIQKDEINITSPTEGGTDGFGELEPMIQFKSYETGFITTIVKTDKGIALFEQKENLELGRVEITDDAISFHTINVKDIPTLLVAEAPGVNTTLRATFADDGEIVYKPENGAFEIKGLQVIDTGDPDSPRAECSTLTIKTLAAPVGSGTT